MDYSTDNLDFILFKTHFNGPLVNEWNNYTEKINRFNQLNNTNFYLYGNFACPNSIIGMNNMIYPEDSFLQEMYNILRTFVDPNGCVIIKNRDGNNVQRQTIANLIEYINDYCSNFSFRSLINAANIETPVMDNNVRILWMNFYTSR